MIIKIRKYEAEISRIVETENGLEIVNETITIEGKRISEATVKSQLPEGSKLTKHGYVTFEIEIPDQEFYDWVNDNGFPVTKI